METFLFVDTESDASELESLKHFGLKLVGRDKHLSWSYLKKKTLFLWGLI